MESSLTKIKKHLKLLVENTFLEFDKSYHNDTPYAFFVRVSPEGNSVYTLMLSEDQLSDIAKHYSTNEKEILNAEYFSLLRQSLRWAIGEQWYVLDNDLLKDVNLLILNAMENGEIELFDGVVENICLEVLESLQKQKFFLHNFQSIVIGLTYRSESDEEFLNWIQKINSLEIVEQVKQELSAMYAAQKLIESR
ncbi:MAG: hypothetical protein RLZZ04_2716 [Cyanobacteriota bacterium]|jgi:hypothetical protein